MVIAIREDRIFIVHFPACLFERAITLGDSLGERHPQAWCSCFIT